MDDKDMQIAAYEERMAQIVVEYERKVAQLRIELTKSDNERQELRQSTSSPTGEPLEGEVV